MTIDFLGKGWSFPLNLRKNAEFDHLTERTFPKGLSMSAGNDKISESIQIILSTSRGERLMRPEFGCDLKKLVFASATVDSLAMAEFYVKEALREFEPRIEVELVEVVPNPEEPTLLEIHIHYEIKRLSSKESLVYPFYLEP